MQGVLKPPCKEDCKSGLYKTNGTFKLTRGGEKMHHVDFNDVLIYYPVVTTLQLFLSNSCFTAPTSG